MSEEIKQKKVESLTDVTVMFAGDSGDGMQLTGTQFSNTTALVGNDLNTLPDYPAEIRAPAGTIYGVSGFQLHFGSGNVHTPGDSPDVLVAMNPAALKKNLPNLKPNAMIIINSDAFDSKGLKLAKYEKDPLKDGSLAGFKVFEVQITTLTQNALSDTGLSVKDIQRSKNFFALGLMYWLFDRPIEPTIEWVETKFKKQPILVDANIKALKAGYYYGDTTEMFATKFKVESSKLTPGRYKNISGNEATAAGLVAASLLSDLPLFLGSYPITPASEILHTLSKYKNYGVITFQAEDEISGISSAIGASFGGHLAITTTSGPGLALKTEAAGLAVITELPLVIVDVQRGGPSTGLPTKTEQADLLQAMYARNGEAPIPIVAASTPSDCFYMAIEASRIALQHMTPVILLTDGYIANGTEPWRIPEVSELKKIEVKYADNPETFQPYNRDENLVRPWAPAGTPGFEHRIGGLEKSNITGDVSYDPDNHHEMVKIRAEKVNRIKNFIPDLEVLGDKDADTIVIGWGGTYGAIYDAVDRVREKGHKVAQAHFRYIHPFPKNTGEVLKKYKKVILPEINDGQLAKLLKAEFLIDIIQHNLIRGLPFRSSDLEKVIIENLGGNND